ncbi:GEVED domain-containing protein [Chryseobacterium sp. OV279]|uniref:GEVED domain-containing protein n=1 Tax=Chryseobacterium sp. OV279 TaxID=1500285 RepID=UPI0009108858|nr:fibronectin type III domain-containing protein [Chryseobacterium sp. OV279]SHE48226.1 Por secretion system C-terminal sorting domain-containing protein [Chryseobacterium sp. OV279]
MSGFLLCKMGRPYRVLITLLCMVFGLFSQAQTVTIGTGTSTQRYPLAPYYGHQRDASLYTAAEINLPAGGSVLSVAWNATVATTIATPVKIYLKTVPVATTTITAQNWVTATAGATLVYDGNIASIPTGWNTVTLQNPYYYNGVENLVVLVETNYGGSGTGSLGGNSFTYSSNTSKHMYIEGDTTPPAGNGTVDANRPNVQLTFGPPPACLPPIGLTSGATTATTAAISWTAPSSAPAGGYDVYYSTTATAPTAATTPSQTVTTGTGVTLSPLVPNTTYYIWIRSKCSGTSQSTWIGQLTVTTPPSCLAPTALTLGTVVPTSANISWTAPSIAPAGGYDVYYSTSATAPTAATVPSQTVTGTTATLSPLVANTTYYVWVRSRCTATDQSSWTGPLTVLTGYCAPTGGTSSNLYYLKTINTTGGISNLNYTANSYSAYVNSSATVFSGLPTNTITMNLNSGTSTYNYYVWVDWNNNMSFNDPGETILATPGYVTSATASIVIPGSQPPGNYRVRTSTSFIGTNVPCGPAPWGNFVDFTLNVIALQPCTTAPPTNITVSNLTPTSAQIGWMPSTGATYVLQYRSLPGGAWTPVSITTPLASSYTITNLTEQTQYEFQIATICGGTQGPFSTATPFTTPAITYCTSASTSTTIDGFISKVAVVPNSAIPMNSVSDFSNYTDYTTDATRLVTLVRGLGSNTVTVNKTWPGTQWSFGTGVWIDFNRNGVFEASEQVLNSPSNTTTPVTATFAVPNAAGGVYMGNLTTRMRVALRESAAAAACGTFTWGEVEDYAVKLIDQPPCTTAPPTNITVTNLTATTATVYWFGAANATYTIRWKLATAGTYTIPPVVLAPGVNTYTIPGLTEQTKYDVQISTTCGGSTGAYSTAVQFTTPPLSYCPMTGTGTNDHISNVTVTSSNPGVPVMNNTSVQTNYTSYITPQTLITLDAGSANNKISVSKGWTGATANVAVSAWIDYNRNGVFETSEQILSSAANTTTPVTNTNFAVPATAYTGPLTTTMRVVLKRTSAPVLCVDPVNGEVEDYAVRIRPCANGTPNLPGITATHNSATITLSGVANTTTYLVRYRLQGPPPGAWTEVYASALLNNIPLVITGLTPATNYEVQVAAVCGDVIGTFTAIKPFVTRCDPTPPNVTVTNITTNSALVTWAPLAASSTYTLEWRKVGAPTWTQVPNIAPPTNTYALTNLDPYTKYEVRVANKCVGETTLNPYSNPKVFTTERTCELPPPGLTILQLTPTSAEVTWEGFPGATYVLRYRKVGIPSWTNVSLITNTYTITGLLEETKYEMQVMNICNGTPGTPTPPYYFTTPTVIYCQMGSQNAVNEHISKVTVTPNGRPKMENASGPSNYTNYTGVPATFIEMVQGSTGNQITIEKKWNGTNHDEGIAVWIDFNRNGYFDLDERVFTSPPNTTSPVTGTFSVPVDAYISMTNYKYVVMRVAMMRDGVPVNCANFANGEVEDYSVRIAKPGVPNSVNQTEILIYPNPVSSVLYVKNISKKAKYKIYNSAGQIIGDGILLNNQINVSKLINGIYVIDIEDNGVTVQKKFIKE